MKVITASRNKLIGPTHFKGYDIQLNTYVGCEFGCSYCYVRFFIKDEEAAWGDFVRIREHVVDKLPKELPKYVGQRLVIGTMTDPYMSLERKHRITRSAIQSILSMESGLNKVGIFTRSPVILDDLDLIVQLPRKRVHYTVTPFESDILRSLEPIAIRHDKRFDTIKKLKEAGVRVHCNIAPALPIFSDGLTEEFANKLAELQVDEFFVDPMQAYSESFTAVENALQSHPDWQAVRNIVLDKEAYRQWKMTYRAAWIEAWRGIVHKSPDTLPIWSDHENKVWIDMRTGQQMNPRLYGDDLEHI